MPPIPPRVQDSGPIIPHEAAVKMISPCLQVSVLAAAAVLILTVPAAHAGELRRATANRIDGRYIVVLRDDAAALVSEPARKSAIPMLAEQIAKAHRVYSPVLRGSSASAKPAALKLLLAHPRVAYVEADAAVFARNSIWKLRVSDNAGGDTGYLDAWSISL
jgi:hypothetical protein